MIYVSKGEVNPNVGKRLVTSGKDFDVVDTILHSNCTMQYYSKNNFNGFITADVEKNFNIQFIQNGKTTKRVTQESYQTGNIIFVRDSIKLFDDKIPIFTSVECLIVTILYILFALFCLWDTRHGRIFKKQQEKIKISMHNILTSFDEEIRKLDYLDAIMAAEDETMEKLEKMKEELDKNEIEWKLRINNIETEVKLQYLEKTFNLRVEYIKKESELRIQFDQKIKENNLATEKKIKEIKKKKKKETAAIEEEISRLFAEIDKDNEDLDKKLALIEKKKKDDRDGSNKKDMNSRKHYY